jgi:predicted polyphosphate/ATP-dependent NAD kinase
LQQDDLMKKLLEAVADVAKTTVLDGNMPAVDVRDNKKKVAVGLAKSVAWAFLQNHPVYIVAKLALWGIAALAVLILGVVGYFTFF